MPWIEKRRHPHSCYAPVPPMRRAPGSIWQCRRCGTRWVLTVNRLDITGRRNWHWDHEETRTEPRTMEVTGQ